MTILSKAVMVELFDRIDAIDTNSIFTSTIEFTSVNSFWGTHIKLKITESQIGKGVLITLFRDGHVTIKHISTFNTSSVKTTMVVLQEGPQVSQKTGTDGNRTNVELILDMTVEQLIDTVVTHYPALKNLRQLKQPPTLIG